MISVMIFFKNKEKIVAGRVKIKKALQLNGKLFIGLTTKPVLRSSVTKQHNYRKYHSQKKALLVTGLLLAFSGLDGTRTRDPVRDRHVF